MEERERERELRIEEKFHDDGCEREGENERE